ncbi:BRCA1-associated RING domain protein 1 [Mortierella claussenii]|nr:BRCA1-associated RING domain protein 1 [Mortierella claussenii]
MPPLRKCIYDTLGTLCKCPTCGIPARVGNLLKNPSYDILVACTSKMRQMQIQAAAGVGANGESEIEEGASPPLHADDDNTSETSDRDERSDTPLGSLLWTYDCGPTFPASLPHDAFSSDSSNIELQTFPSLNAALTIHDRERERTMRATNSMQELDQSASVIQESNVHSRDADKRLMPPPPPNVSAPSPPVPTMSQLRQLLGMPKKEPSTIPSSQENETQTTLPLNPTTDSSEPASDTTSEFATPRMPSPSLRLDESSIESVQTAVEAPVPRGSSGSQRADRPSRKRRMLTEDIQAASQASKASKLTGNKRRSGSPQVTSTNISLSTHRTIPSNNNNTGNEETESSTKDQDALVVQSSQPSFDMMALSLMPHDDMLGRRTRRDSSQTPDPTSPATDAPSSKEIAVARRDDKSRPEMITCIFTGLNKQQRDQFDQTIGRVIEAGLLMEHIQDQPFSETTTHIITDADPDALRQTGVALCHRVLKYLHGLLSSSWIVHYDWFVDSIDAGAWLPLPDPTYMIRGDLQFGPAPGTQLRREIRMQKSLKLFDSCRMFFYGSFGSSIKKSAITKDELLRLVRDGGAETSLRRPAAKPPSSTSNSNNSLSVSSSIHDFYSPDRSWLYITEDVKPWEVAIDRSAPIIVCDPTTIPSGTSSKEGSPSVALSQADLKRHAWLREHQAVSLTWILNCISCSLMGLEDIERLYGPGTESETNVDDSLGKRAVDELTEAWTSWRSRQGP